MNTFLPYPDFKSCAECLDNKRLGKQRVEAWQIFLALTIPTYGWKHHPAVKMWANNIGSLLLYGICCCEEWIARGFDDSLLEKFMQASRDYPNTSMPIWMGNDRFHAGHRSNLLRKDMKYYSRFGWQEKDDMSYYWPV